MSSNQQLFATLPTEHRIATVQGAANAAVGAMNRLSWVLPPMPHPDLHEAGSVLAANLAQLEQSVVSLLADLETQKKKPAAPSSEASADYATLQREYEALQEIAVSYKQKYEEAEKARSLLFKQVQEAEAKYAGLKARTDAVSEGIGRTITVVEQLLENA